MKTKKIYKNRNKINESRNLETKKKKNLSIFGELLTSSLKTKAGRMVGK
jgi:hypothetical protein